MDDEGGDEVDLSAVLRGIAGGRDAQLLTEGAALSALDASRSLSLQQQEEAALQQLDSSMLDSVLKALEEEEEEEQEDDSLQQQQQQQQPPLAQGTAGRHRVSPGTRPRCPRLSC